MRKHVTHLSHIAAALLIAAAGVACNRNGVHNDRRDQSGGNRGVNERIALRGCIQPAPAGQGFALQHVVVVPSVEQPQGNETMENPLIPRGSWVRLSAGGNLSDDFKKYLNNEVTVMGDIVNRGEDTIGTSGQDHPQPARASVANGDAPNVAVEKVQKIADNCVGG